MGFFDKFKKKVNEKVEKVVEKTTESVSEVFKFNKFKEGLNKTKKNFSDKLKSLLGGRKIDAELLEDIEAIMLTADIGIHTTESIIETIKEKVKQNNIEDAEIIYSLLKEEIHNILVTSPSSENDRIYAIDENKKPYTIMVIGVNGVGKTTTIGKLAHNYKSKGYNVIIGAADTFRAAANEQLSIWANRANVDLIQQSQGADPGAVVYDTINSAISKKKDIVIIDTAGRLHNKGGLMSELEKLTRVTKKLKPDGPDEVYLVLDATTGQNAIQQAKEFMKVSTITGIVLTKLDGTAKGGVVIPIAAELKLPVRYIGVGEQMNDLQVFDPTYFVEALFGSESGEDTVLED